MAHQGLHGFLARHVFPDHFAAAPAGGGRENGEDGEARAPRPHTRGARDRSSPVVSRSNLQAIALGLNVMNGLRDYLRAKRGESTKKARDKDGTLGRVLDMFRSRAWTLVDVEAPVLVREWDLNTRLDAVVYDRRIGRYMCVEIKIGYRDFLRPRGTFFAPFEHVPNTGANQARAQAVVGTLMTERDARFPAATPIEGIYVMWVRKTGITVFRAAEWCVAFMDHVRTFLDAMGPERRQLAADAAAPPPPPPPREIVARTSTRRVTIVRRGTTRSH